MGKYDGLVPNTVPSDKETPMKKFWQSKTFWVNALTAVAGIAAYFQSEVVADNPEIVGGIGAALGIINVILRFMTKEPVAVK